MGLRGSGSDGVSVNSENEGQLHVDGERIAAYLDGKLAPEEHPRVEAHLADCDACRTELLAVTRILESQRRQRRLYTLGPVAAAAAIVGLVLFLPFRSERTGESRGDAGVERSVAAEGTAVVATVAPSETAAVSASELVFTWRSSGPDAFYRLTVIDETGDEIWTDETADSVLFLPPGVAMEPGGRYFWYVDALLSDGSSATTGMHQFMIVP